MQRFSDDVINQAGRPQAGVAVTVSVTNASCGTGALASLFSDDGITATGNPIFTDALGRYGFYVPTGKYDLVFSGGSIVTFCRSAVEIGDFLEFKTGDLAPTSTGNWLATGNWTFSGSNVHNGTESFTAGGSLAGTFTGSPVLSGSPVFSGTPSFTGTGNTGTLGLGATALAANNAFTGSDSFTQFNKVIYVDGITYAFTGAGVQNAINAACTGGVPGKVVLPPQLITGITTQITVGSSNCTIEGHGKYISVLQASVGSTTVLFGVASTISHVRLANFGLDNNRVAFDCFDLAGTDIVVDGLRVSNCGNQGLLISGPATGVAVRNSEFDRNGTLTITNPGTGAITIAPGAANISKVLIGPGNLIHDNNSAVQLINPTSSANFVYDVSVFENDIYANANDAILFSANTATGGKIFNPSAKGNRLNCNGSGTGFSTNCTAGFMQSGNSAGGVGVDIIQNADQLLVSPIVSDNHCHDNLFECVALTTNFASSVNTANSGGNTTITWVSGPTFNTNWKANQTIAIGAIAPASLSKIVSVASTTSMTVAGNLGTQTGVTFYGPSAMNASIIGNKSLNDGSAAQSGVGPGFFCFMADYSAYSGNVSRSAYLEGFEALGCNFTTYSGDKAISNSRGAVAGRNYGFVSYGSLANTYWGVVADDPVASPKQTIGLNFDPNTTNGLLFSTSIFGSTTPVNGAGSNGNIYVNSSPTLVGNLQLNDAGNGIAFAHSGLTALVPQSASGNFTQTLQALTATVTDTIASGTAAMTTAAITAGNCGTTVTVSATGALTTDTIAWAFNAAPAGSNAGLVAWPTANNVNFAYCSNTAQTPAAATINWKVLR